MIHGAAARPFVTHMNALDTDLYLRIATEIYLASAVVGGVDHGAPRDEPATPQRGHGAVRPEFTSLEAYDTYSDHNGMAELTRDLIQHCARCL